MNTKVVVRVCIAIILIFLPISVFIIYPLKPNNTDESNINYINNDIGIDFDGIEEAIIKIAVFPSGLSDTYYFLLTENRVMQSYFGDRINDDICEKNL